MSIGPNAKRRIVVVCYGNICRSPAAEALLKRALRAAGLERGYLVRSAGVAAQPGTPAARGMQAVAERHGVDLRLHRARPLTREMVREASTVIALDEVVEEEIRILAGEVDIVLWPVDDPYGGPASGYAHAFTEIEAHVRALVHALRTGNPTAP